MSPSSGTGMSPSYPHSEPSPDPLGSYNTVVLGSRVAPRTHSNSPPLTPNAQSVQNQNGIYFYFNIFFVIVFTLLFYFHSRCTVNINGSIYGSTK